MHQPELLILHEPTLGLEPLLPREFRALVEETVKRGATDLLWSHALSEVELLCDRVALIKKRCLVRVGTLGELRASRSAAQASSEMAAQPPNTTLSRDGRSARPGGSLASVGGESQGLS